VQLNVLAASNGAAGMQADTFDAGPASDVIPCSASFLVLMAGAGDSFYTWDVIKTGIQLQQP